MKKMCVTIQPQKCMFVSSKHVFSFEFYGFVKA